MHDFQYQTPLRLLNERDIIKANVRFGSCVRYNSMQSFSITAAAYTKDRLRGEATVVYNGRTYWNHMGGCCHEELSRAFPELAEFVKWHLVGEEGPMHYITNGMYWLEVYQRRAAGLMTAHPATTSEALANFKSTVVFGWAPQTLGLSEMEVITDDDLAIIDSKMAESWLLNRLPGLMEVFMKDMEKASKLKFV